MSEPIKLEQLVLEKYGPYADRVLRFRPDAALHIVLGRNEAGKSLALRALTDLFCGFPKSIAAEDFRVLRFKSADLRLGASLISAEGKHFAFRRRAGRSNTLLGAQDSERLAENATREFFAEPDRSLFETEFGLTAGALRSGARAILDAGGRLSETLAAGSGQLSALNSIRSALQAEADTLYAAGGRARKINQALERYQTAGKEFRNAVVSADALKRARETLEAAEAQRREIDEKLRAVEKRRNQLVRAHRTHAKLRERAERMQRLDGFSSLADIGETTFATWKEAFAHDAALIVKIAGAEAQLRDLESETADMKPAPELLAEAGAVEALREMLGAADKARDDLPKREEAARNGWQGLERAADTLGLGGADELVQRMPAEIALTRVRDLLRKLTSLEQKQTAASGRLKKALERRSRVEQSGPPPADDPAPLLRAFEVFNETPTIAARLRERAADLDEQIAKLEREAQRLHPPAGGLTILLQLPLPDAANIEAAMRRAIELADGAKQLTRDNEALSRRIAVNSKAQHDLTREGDVASPDDLAAARRRRDEALDTIQANPDFDAHERGLRFNAVRRAIADTDRLTDILLGSADRAARQQALTADLRQIRIEEAALDEAAKAHASLGEDHDAQWRALWKDCGLEPLEPGGMREWRAKVSAIVERHENFSTNRSAFASAQVELRDLAGELAAFAPRAGVQAGEGEAAATLYGRIRDVLGRMQKAWSDGRAHAADLANAEREINEAKTELSGLENDKAEIDEQWSRALKTLSLAPDAGVAEAEEALKIWPAAISDLRLFRSEDHRVKTIRQDIDAFEERTGALGARFCPDISGEAPRKIVEALSQRLEQARAAASGLARLAATRAKISRDIEAYERERAKAKSVLQAATTTLGLGPGEGELEAALSQLDERAALQQEIETLTKDISVAGDGLRPDELKAEQAGLDFDTIDAELASLNAQHDVVFAGLGPAAIAADAAGKALADLEAGHDAPRFALEREEAAAELLETARDWLIRAGAAKLAWLAIEKHRERHQDPVIARISTLFARATGGEFSGAVISYEDDDQPVFKGLRKNGEVVGVEGLSEGTRDQLFLALRLALLEQRKEEPYPFIGDDLLASFDDERAGCAIDLLADFGAHRQTILFTHHRHIAEIAGKRLGGQADVIELTS